MKSLCNIVILIPIITGYFSVIQAEVQQFTRTEKPVANANTLLRKFYDQAGRNWIVRWSKDGKRVQSLVGREDRPGKTKGAEKARDFLRAHSRLFGLRPDLHDLKIVHERTSPGGSHIEFQQLFQGIPVENGKIKINLDETGRVLTLHSSYLPVDKGFKPQLVAITADEALEIAIQEFLKTTPRIPPGKHQLDAPMEKPVERDKLKLRRDPAIEQVFLVVNDELHLAHKIVIYASYPFGIKEYIVDAKTGAVLRMRNRLQHAENADGQVFLPDPVNYLNQCSFCITS